MKYATGYALNAKEIVYSFKYNKISITPEECMRLIGKRNREIIVEKLFKYSIKLILDDIIHNNVSFKLPTSQECYLYMKEFYDDDFIRCRKKGKWQTVDFYSSNYTSYQLMFKYKSHNFFFEKPIYCNTEYRDSIISYINSGRTYHDCNVKVINDYYEKLQEEFPMLKLSDIATMVKFAWRMLYLANYHRCDTVITSTKYKFWFLIGKLTKDPIAHYDYYRYRIRSKIRFLRKQRGIKWDGYYYFGLREEEYREYKAMNKPTGRKKKWFTFKKKVLYSIMEEANLSYNGSVCIMRIVPPTYLGTSYYKETLKCANPEIYLLRDPLKFEDILLTNNNYVEYARTSY